MTVITAAQHHYEGLDGAVEEQLIQSRAAGQQHWASLPNDAQLVSVDNTGHVIQIDCPDVVSEQIRRMIPTAN